MFLGKTLCCHGASLSTQVYKWETVNYMLGGDPVMDEHPIWGGGVGRNTLSHFRLQKLEISTPLYGALGLNTDLTYVNDS